jgi:hypothetical protein
MKDGAELKGIVQTVRGRNWIAMLLYAVAIPAAYLHPAISLGLILGISLLYFAPDAVKRGA